MELFKNDVLNITKIHTVNMYDEKNDLAHIGKTFYSSKLPTYELIFFFCGNSEVVFGDKVMYDAENTIRYLPKGDNKGIYSVKKIESSICIDIYFDTNDAMPEKAFVLKNVEELKNSFLKIYNVWSSKKTGYYAECMSVFYDIIKKIKLRPDNYRSGDITEKLHPSLDYMLENFCSHDFNYRKMCACSDLSYDYFKELFISRFGMPPVKYVTQLRLERAKELLVTGRYSVTEIAENCGFENVYYFSTVFKKYVGVSPSKYKLM